LFQNLINNGVIYTFNQLLLFYLFHGISEIQDHVG